jgi:hypothetical protein
MGHLDHGQAVDPGEVARVARVDRQFAGAASIRPSGISVLRRGRLEPSSDRGVDYDEVAAQGGGVDRGKPRPPPTQLVKGDGRPGEGDQLRHRLAGTGDRQSLVALGSLHDLTPVVPQVSYRDVRHAKEGVTRDTGRSLDL